MEGSWESWREVGIMEGGGNHGGRAGNHGGRVWNHGKGNHGGRVGNHGRRVENHGGVGNQCMCWCKIKFSVVVKKAHMFTHFENACMKQILSFVPIYVLFLYLYQRMYHYLLGGGRASNFGEM